MFTKPHGFLGSSRTQQHCTEHSYQTHTKRAYLSSQHNLLLYIIFTKNHSFKIAHYELNYHRRRLKYLHNWSKSCWNRKCDRALLPVLNQRLNRETLTINGQRNPERDNQETESLWFWIERRNETHDSMTTRFDTSECKSHSLGHVKNNFCTKLTRSIPRTYPYLLI